MLDVPQPTATKQEDADGDTAAPTHSSGSVGDVGASPSSSPAIVPVTEDASTLGLLLKLCYPSARLPTFPTFDSMKPVLVAAHLKYRIDHVFDVLGPRLQEISRKTPVRVYAFAAKYGSGGDGCRMSPLMQNAAHDFLALPDMWCYADELGCIDAATYYRLLMYRNLCTRALQELRRTPLRAWFPDPPQWIWFTCDRCVQHTDRNWNHTCNPSCGAARWFQAYWARLFDVLLTPHADAIRRPELADQVLQEAYGCDNCRGSMVSEQIRRFIDLLAADIERRLSKLSPDNIPCVAFSGEPELKGPTIVDEA